VSSHREAPEISKDPVADNTDTYAFVSPDKPDTVTLIANALRAGSSFLQAIELVVRESRPPISVEFSRVIREVNLGLPFEQAMENMVRRVRSDDLELMATAINIQHTVGGNLAEILDSIAFTIRERVRIKGEIRTLTAQQRLSGYVVAGLPFALSAFLFVVAPKFFDPMFDKDVAIGGGADVIRQGLAAGLIDEILLHVAPVVLGGGKRLFDGFEKDLDLRIASVHPSQWAVHTTYDVLR